MTTPATRRPTSSASTSSSASSTSSRSAPRTRPTPSTCFARQNPLHAQAPVMQARVIEIYEKSRLRPTWRSSAQEGLRRPLRPRRASSAASTPRAGTRRSRWSRPRLAELARHYHASAQKTKSSADYAGSGALVPRVPGVVPERPGGGRRATSCSPSCCSRTAASPRPASNTRRRPTSYPKHAKSADAGYGALLGYARRKKARRRPSCRRCSARRVASALRFAAGVPDDARTGPVLTDAAEKLYALHETDAGRRGRAARARSQAAGRRRAAPRRLDRDRLRLVRRATPSTRAEKAFAEAIKLTPEKDPARADLVERQAAAIYKQAELARARRQARRTRRRASRASAPWPPQLGGARERAVRRRGGADRDQGLGRRDQDARGLPPALPEPCAAARGRARSSRVAYLEKGQWANAAARVRAPRDRPATPTRRSRATRSGRRPSCTTKAGTRKPQAAKAYERYLALSTRRRSSPPSRRAIASRSSPRDGGNAAREARADARHLRRRPGRRQRAHRPHPLPRRDAPRWRWPSRSPSRIARSRWSSRCSASSS